MLCSEQWSETHGMQANNILNSNFKSCKKLLEIKKTKKIRLKTVLKNIKLVTVIFCILITVYMSRYHSTIFWNKYSFQRILYDLFDFYGKIYSAQRI